MAIPLIPFAGLALGALGSLSLLAIQGLLQDRSFGNDPSLPEPEPQIPPFELPFEGGQCSGLEYRIGYSYEQYGSNGDLIASATVLPENGVSIFGAISSIETYSPSPSFSGNGIIVTGRDSVGSVFSARQAFNFPQAGIRNELISTTVVLASGQPDNCGNLPNPNDPIPPSTGGGNLAPIVDAPVEVYGGLPVFSFAALLAALKTIADAIGVIGDVLEGVRKIGDAINKIREILDEFLNGEKDKNKKERDKRKVSTGAWREMLEDGGFGVEKFTAQEIEYSPFQLQIEIEEFPSTVSRRLGVKSPTYAHLEPIGWVFLRSSNGGYSEPIPLRYLRNSISLNEDTNGVSYSFRENPLVKAKCRVWWSSDPEVTGNI